MAEAAKTKKCNLCGAVHPADDVVLVPGYGNVCPKCRERKFVPCGDCGKLLAKATATCRRPGEEANPEAQPICTACRESYKTCEPCGAVFSINAEGAVRTGRSSWVCPDCGVGFAKPDLGNEWAVPKRQLVKAIDLDGGMKIIPKGWPTDSKSRINMPSMPADRKCRAPLYNDASGKPGERVGNCRICGARFIHTGATNLMWANGNTFEVCKSCFDKQLADCGHIYDDPRTVVTLRENKLSGEVDVDGVQLRDRPSETDLPDWYRAGAVVCAECYEAQRGRLSRAGFTAVKQYSYAPMLVFHKVADEDSPFMGFELEVDKGRDVDGTAREVIKAVGQKHVFIKRDGSLGNGFEQVTHPATIEYMLAERPRYEKLLDLPRKGGFTSHDAGTCGLHVHVDRKYFGDGSKRDLGIKKTLYLAERFYPELFLFSRRDQSAADNWAHRAMTALDGALISKADLDKLYESVVNGGDRRRVVNLQRPPTMEFRIFRGTLNPVTFWATLQLVSNIVWTAKHTEVAKLDDLTWRSIIDARSYPELTEYNERRVGDGWSGEKIQKTRLVDDKGAERVEDVAVTAIKRESLRPFKGLYFRADNAALVAAWPGLKDALIASKRFTISAQPRGELYVVQEPLSSLNFALGEANSKPTLCRTDFGGAYPLSWIIIEEGFVAGLKAEAADVLVGAADRTIDCIKIKEAV